jgi:hypothetical protein
MAITYALEGGSSVQDQLGTGHLVAGRVTASAGTDAVLTSNDKSLTLTRTAAGDYTINFGEPFVAAPFVAVAVVQPTFSTASAYSAQLVAVATNSVQVNIYSVTGTTVLGALADLDFHFHAVGKRYN